MRWQGQVVSGLGEASRFMSFEWVKQQIERLLGIPVYPGTINLLCPRSGELLRWIESEQPLVIEPPAGSNFCRGFLYPVMIGPADAYGAILRPDVGDYPADKIELVAGFLPVEIGDWLELRPADDATRRSS